MAGNSLEDSLQESKGDVESVLSLERGDRRFVSIALDQGDRRKMTNEQVRNELLDLFINNAQKQIADLEIWIQHWNALKR